MMASRTHLLIWLLNHTEPLSRLGRPFMKGIQVIALMHHGVIGVDSPTFKVGLLIGSSW